jgi:MFS family permease
VASRSAATLGDALISVTLAFAAIDLGAGPAGVGAVLMASRLPPVLFGLPAAAWADRFPQWRVLVAADLGRVATQSLTAALLLTGHATLVLLAVLQALAATGGAFFEPAAEAMTAELVAPGRRQRANAVLGLSRSVGMVLGPAVAAAIVARVDVGWAFAGHAATFAASAVLLTGLRRRAVTPDHPGVRLLGSMRQGWREFRGRSWLWASTVITAVFNGACLAPILALGPLVAPRELDAATSWATIMTGFAVGGVLGGLAAMRWTVRHPLRVASAVSLLVVPMPSCLATAQPVAVTTVAGTLAGAQAAVFNLLAATARQNHVPAAMRARMAGLASVLAMAAVPLGMAAAGVVAERVGVGAVLVGSVVAATATAACGLAVRSIRNLPTSPSG